MVIHNVMFGNFRLLLPTLSYPIHQMSAILSYRVPTGGNTSAPAATKKTIHLPRHLNRWTPWDIHCHFAFSGSGHGRILFPCKFLANSESIRLRNQQNLQPLGKAPAPSQNQFNAGLQPLYSNAGRQHGIFSLIGMLRMGQPGPGQPILSIPAMCRLWSYTPILLILNPPDWTIYIFTPAKISVGLLFCSPVIFKHSALVLPCLPLS